MEIAARAKAAEFKKSDFALTFAIEDKDWVAPKYLLDGIAWLAADEFGPGDSVMAAGAEAVVEAFEGEVGKPDA